MIVVSAHITEMYGGMEFGADAFFIAKNRDLAIDYAIRMYLPDWRGESTESNDDIVQALFEDGEADLGETLVSVSFGSGVYVFQEQLDFMEKLQLHTVYIPENYLEGGTWVVSVYETPVNEENI